MELLPSLFSGLKEVCAAFPHPRKGRSGNIGMADFGLSASLMARQPFFRRLNEPGYICLPTAKLLGVAQWSRLDGPIRIIGKLKDQTAFPAAQHRRRALRALHKGTENNETCAYNRHHRARWSLSGAMTAGEGLSGPRHHQACFHFQYEPHQPSLYRSPHQWYAALPSLR